MCLNLLKTYISTSLLNLVNLAPHLVYFLHCSRKAPRVPTTVPPESCRWQCSIATDCTKFAMDVQVPSVESQMALVVGTGKLSVPDVIVTFVAIL